MAEMSRWVTEGADGAAPAVVEAGKAGVVRFIVRGMPLVEEWRSTGIGRVEAVELTEEEKDEAKKSVGFEFGIVGGLAAGAALVRAAAAGCALGALAAFDSRRVGDLWVDMIDNDRDRRGDATMRGVGSWDASARLGAESADGRL